MKRGESFFRRSRTLSGADSFRLLLKIYSKFPPIIIVEDEVDRKTIKRPDKISLEEINRGINVKLLVAKEHRECVDEKKIIIRKIFPLERSRQITPKSKEMLKLASRAESDKFWWIFSARR